MMIGSKYRIYYSVQVFMIAMATQLNKNTKKVSNFKTLVKLALFERIVAQTSENITAMP